MEQEESNTLRRSTWWILSVLLVPLLYFLTAPPVVFLTIRHVRKSGAPQVPQWLEVYGKPYEWAMDYTPFEGVLEDYVGWWDRYIFDKGAP